MRTTVRKYLAAALSSALLYMTGGTVHTTPAVAQSQVLAGLEEMQALMKEAMRLKQEREANVGEANALKPVFERLTARKRQLDAEDASLRAEGSHVDSLCHRTVPEEQYASAVAACDAVLTPYNARVESLKANAARLAEEGRREEARLQHYVQREDEILARLTVIQARVEALRNTDELSRLERCAVRCQSVGEEEPTAQCMQSCFDGAAKTTQSRPLVDPRTADQGTKTFSGRPRTQEQAIKEYKNSGSANPGRRLGAIKAPPVPGTR